jgi:hypothetical protein
LQAGSLDVGNGQLQAQAVLGDGNTLPILRRSIFCGCFSLVGQLPCRGNCGNGQHGSGSDPLDDSFLSLMTASGLEQDALPEPFYTSSVADNVAASAHAGGQDSSPSQPTSLSSCERQRWVQNCFV